MLTPASTALTAWKVVEKNGAPAWEKAWVSKEMVSPLPPVVINGVLFALSSGEFRSGDTGLNAAERAKKSANAVLYALDPLTGNPMWTSGDAITSFVHSGGLSAGGGRIFVATYDGTQYAFGFPWSIRSQKSGSRMEMMNRSISFCSWHSTAAAQSVPDGPGRQEMETKCKQCHELARSISVRQDRDGWTTTMAKMVAFGMKGSEKELALIVDYLAKNYPADDIPKVNVNKATAIELESDAEPAAFPGRRRAGLPAKNGDFKSLDDLKKVPMIDAEKIEARKDRIAF